MIRWIWAARDVLRRPGEAALAALVIISLTAVVGASLLLTEALARTARRLTEAGPAVVVRRLDGGGWAAMPVAALAAAQGVRGVTSARGRIWGAVGGPEGALTVVGLGAAEAKRLGIDAPEHGTATLGAGLGAVASIALKGVLGVRELRVNTTLPRTWGAALHGVALVHPDDARWLLGVPAGHVSDLAIEVRHRSERAAILPDLVAAMPWPVRAVPSDEAAGALDGRLARRGGLSAMVALPAVLGAVFLLLGVARDRVGRRAEVGLLKAMGWATGDVVALHLRRALVVGVPATALGLAGAWVLAFGAGADALGASLFGWQGTPPLALDADGALLVLAEVGGLTVVPWCLASIWPAFRAATVDPHELLGGEA